MIIQEGESFGYKTFFTEEKSHYNMKSLGVSRLAYIEKSHFIEILADFENDYV